MASKFDLVEKFELFLSNIMFFSQKNILNLEFDRIQRLTEMSELMKSLIVQTEESDDYNQLWSMDFESVYDNLCREYFEIIVSKNK
jgi:hypothetical protein